LRFLGDSLGCKELPQLSYGAKQMDSDRRFAQPESLTDFTGAMVSHVAHGKDDALTIGELLDRVGDVSGALARDHAIFGARLHGRRIGRDGFGRRGHRQRPAKPARTRLAEIETPIHKDSGKPHLEGVFLSIARYVSEHFDECVLHCLIGIVRVAKVAVGDSHRASLMLRNKIAELLPRAITFSREHQGFETCRQRGIP
jgi:hypothetical protein